METIHNLRKKIIKNLEKLTYSFRISASKKISDLVLENEIFIKSQKIACYVPIKNEVNIWPVIKYIWFCGKKCYLPIFNQQKGRHLQFTEFNKSDRLIFSEYKIVQPKMCIEKNIDPCELDLVITPLLGFNKQLFRFGRGLGCYDYTFGFKLKNFFCKPYLIGVAYKCQFTEFKQKSWDIRLDKIITEQDSY